MGEVKVSIIIPVYNGGNYLKEAIDSALNQTYKNIEVLVINDGSCDNGETEKIALSYGDKIRYFYKENGGVSSALNLGISEMRGEYFSWLSHDDVYLPEKIENQLKIIEKYGDENSIAYCASKYIDKNSKLFKGKAKKKFKREKLYSWKRALVNMLKKGTYGGCQFLIPKKVFSVSGLFDENLRYSQDTLMWMKIFTCGFSLVYCEKVGVYSRIHDKQLTQTGKEILKKDSLRIAQIMADDLLNLTTRKHKYFYYFVKRNAKHGNKEVVLYCIKKTKSEKVLSLKEKLGIKTTLFYGTFRPLLRRLYYKFIKRVKTQ